MHTITTLAASRIRYHKSRSILTAIAIMLTTTLLMTVGTSAVGLLDMNRQEAASEGNVHATFNDLTPEQAEMLKNHMDVEAIETRQFFASVEYEKMNGSLNSAKVLKDGIYHALGNLIEGHEAILEDEICGPAAFFERMGVEGKIGNKITISFRPGGEGEIVTKEFTICGIVSAVDISTIDISDSRIAYSATVSETLADEYIEADKKRYTANIRVFGEEELSYDEITEKIENVAEDIGYSVDNIRFNSSYLFTMTDPGTEAMQIAAAIALLIIIFSGLIIYSIYYVGVITDVQEIGRLKALGASKKQIKRLFLTEGMCISVIAVPTGLVLGYLLPRIFLTFILNKVIEQSLMISGIGKIHMFSLPITLVVTAVVLLTVYISMRKPMRMAVRISPIEAIRYQESSSGGKVRKGKKDINVFGLSTANLMRNKKRTIVTITSMGLSCVLFMSLAGVLGSMREEDIARRSIPEGDFNLYLDFSLNDKVYPENNLDSLQTRNIFSEEFVETIENIPGVESVERGEKILISSEYPSELFEDGNRVSMSYIDREQAGKYQNDLERGEIDYDAMISECGAIYTSDVSFDMYGFTIGDSVPLTVYDGDRTFPLTIKITATVNDGGKPYFVLPEEIWTGLGLTYDPTAELYISVDRDRYDECKEVLAEISDSGEYFRLYSMDEELNIGRQTIILIKYPMYMILLMIAVIGFMNLINTMITSIVTRKRELGILQAIGLSDRQLAKMLAGEGLVFTVGTLFASVSIGNLFGYVLFLWAKDSRLLGLSMYHYPLAETFLLVFVLTFGQLGITGFISRRIHKESLIERIRSE